MAWRGPTQRGKSFVRNMRRTKRGFQKWPGDYRIGYYLYKSRYSGSGSYGGKSRLGFIIQSGKYLRLSDAKAALKRGRWKKK